MVDTQRLLDEADELLNTNTGRKAKYIEENGPLLKTTVKHEKIEAVIAETSEILNSENTETEDKIEKAPEKTASLDNTVEEQTSEKKVEIKRESEIITDESVMKKERELRNEKIE